MKQAMFSSNKKPKTPKSPASPTVGDLFQAERPSNYLSNNDLSPKEESSQEEGHFSFQPIKKFSVIAKVKEKARKWKQNLGKKKLDQDTFEDYEKDEDLHRHEGPSKLFTLRRSSSNNKEGLRLRAMPGLSFNEKQVFSYSTDRGYTEHCQKITHNKRLPLISRRGGEDDIKQTPSVRDEPPNYEKVVEEAKEKAICSEDEKATDPESEETDEEAKVMPLASPEKGRAPTPSPEEGAFEGEMQEIDSPPSQMKSLVEAVTEKLVPVSASGSVDLEQEPEPEQEQEQEQEVQEQEGSSVSGVDSNDHECEEECKRWDRGLSVKEYIKNKLEPGDDERALSQVISEAISPRRTPGDKGVIEKVKEAVTLLLLAEQRQIEQQEQEQEEGEEEQSSTSHLLRHSSSSLQIPISTNAYEDELDVEEESQGRILQAN